MLYCYCDSMVVCFCGYYTGKTRIWRVGTFCPHIFQGFMFTVRVRIGSVVMVQVRSRSCMWEAEERSARACVCAHACVSSGFMCAVSQAAPARVSPHRHRAQRLLRSWTKIQNLTFLQWLNRRPQWNMKPPLARLTPLKHSQLNFRPDS